MLKFRFPSCLQLSYAEGLRDSCMTHHSYLATWNTSLGAAKTDWGCDSNTEYYSSTFQEPCLREAQCITESVHSTFST